MAQPIFVGSANMSSTDMWDAIKAEYIVGDLINTGRDGTVIRVGQHKTTKRQVALKVVRAEPEVNGRARERALLEARLHARLTPHKYVVDLFGVYQSSTEVVLVVEYCRSGDLLDRVNDHGRYIEAEARHMFKQILSGVAHVYSQGIAHRDIKLDNIFIHLDSSNGKEAIKVADFGFATEFTPGVNFRTSCGTLAYAAPELLTTRDNVNYDGERADVWSLGVVLYALVVAVLPFSGNGDADLMCNIKAGDFRMPRSISPSLRDLIAAMLSVDASKRPTLAELQSNPWVVGEKKPRLESEKAAIKNDTLLSSPSLAGPSSPSLADPCVSPMPAEGTSRPSLLEECSPTHKKQGSSWKRFLRPLIQV